MNELEAIQWNLDRYQTILARQIDRLYNALEELQRTSLLLLELEDASGEKIDSWLEHEGFGVDEDGFFQSLPLLQAFREGSAPAESISFSWGRHLQVDETARRHLYCHRNIGPHLKHIHDRLGDVGWIYYQDTGNTSLQYPYIDQRTAIPSDFDWSAYHTFVSACPRNNPERLIRWTAPSIDYAGEGMILSVSIPVWRQDTFLGLWSIDLPLRYLYRDFASASSLPDQQQFIVDRRGLLLLHEKLQAEIDKSKGELSLHQVCELGGGWATLDLAGLIERKTGELAITDEDSVEWRFCYSYVPEVEWLLFCGLPRMSMEESASQRLSQAFRQIAEGNYLHRIDATSLHALPTLIEEFNRMSQRLGKAEQRRQEMENQLRQAQKLEAVGRLAGGVAHDYNNMVNVIMGYAEMILEHMNPDDEFYPDVQEIWEAGKRSMELTRQLLAFARCQAISPRVLDINKLVDNMYNMLRQLIGEDIELIWCPGKQVWPIRIDPSQIDQILANLCVNARDAIDGVGRITIETANARLDEEYCRLHRGCSPGEFVQLTVSDNGQGMDAALLEKIFEPFFSTKTVGKGTGLGLATIYGIVKQNDGYINVYSEPGLGSRFKIYFPRLIGAEVVPFEGTGPATAFGSNETILVVEDEFSIRRLAEKMLAQMGYRVMATSSPLEAVRLAETHRNTIDLLLSDVIMPGMNGQELATRLQAIIPDLRILFMSGYTANVIARSGILERDVLLLQKPFSQEELAARIRQALSTPEPIAAKR